MHWPKYQENDERKAKRYDQHTIPEEGAKGKKKVKWCAEERLGEMLRLNSKSRK